MKCYADRTAQIIIEDKRLRGPKSNSWFYAKWFNVATTNKMQEHVSLAMHLVRYIQIARAT